MKKFNKKIIPYLSISSLFYLIIISFGFLDVIFIDFVDVSLLITAAVIISIIAVIIYSYLYYLSSEYEFQEKGVYVRRGVLYRKKSFLEYKNIHAINKKQNFLEHIFGIARLLIDSGSTNTAYNNEIIIYEDSKLVDKMMEELKLVQKNGNLSNIESNEKTSDEKENLFEFTKKLKVFNVFIDALRVFIGFLFAYILINLYCLILQNIIVENFFGIVLLATSIIVFGVFILVFVIGLIVSFVHYYNFRVYRNDDDIEINYGLFTVFHHSFKINKIKAVIVKQSLIYRLFGYASINLEVIGYGEETQNQNTSNVNKYLIPICRYSDSEMLIEKILGDYTEVKKEDTCKSYFSLFSWTLLFFSLASLIVLIFGIIIMYILNKSIYILYFIIPLFVLYFIIVGIILLDKYLQYKYEGLGITKNKLTIYHGGLFRVKTTLLNKHIIGVTSSSTPLRIKNNIYTYNIHIKTNHLTNVYKSEILDGSVKEKLDKVVRL